VWDRVRHVRSANTPFEESYTRVHIIQRKGAVLFLRLCAFASMR